MEADLASGREKKFCLKSAFASVEQKNLVWKPTLRPGGEKNSVWSPLLRRGTKKHLFETRLCLGERKNKNLFPAFRLGRQKNLVWKQKSRPDKERRNAAHIAQYATHKNTRRDKIPNYFAQKQLLFWMKTVTVYI
ncbi:MAG: hypothetical protein J1D88_08670 [Treponema sp.]|nr:hypothetical protein [Treponema sp.]